MVGWQITATTIYCDEIDGEVTVIVQKDGAVRCVRYNKHNESGKSAEQVKCSGPECRLVIEYRDRLFAEDTEQSGSSEGNGPEKQPKQRQDTSR